MKNLSKNLMAFASCGAILSIVMSQSALAQTRVPQVKPIERPAPTRQVLPPKEVKQPLQTMGNIVNAKAGHILVVEFGTGKYRYWHVPVSGSGVSASGWKTVPVSKRTETVEVNVTNALGAYYTQTSGANIHYKRDISGQFGVNDTDNDVDAPLVYLDPVKSAEMASIMASDNGAGIQSLHNTAYKIAAGLQADAAALEADFVTQMREHVAQSVEAGQGYIADANAIIDETRLTPSGAPGSKMQDILERFKVKAESDKAIILAESQNYEAMIPNGELLINGCNKHMQGLEAKVNQIVAADEAQDDADDAAGTEDDDPDSQQPGNNYREEIMDDAENTFERCLNSAIGEFTGLTENDFPVKDLDEAPYLAFHAEADALRADLELSLDAFQQQMEAPGIQAQFSLNPQDELAYQIDMLKALLPLDSTGEIASTLSSLQGKPGPISVQNQLKSTQPMNKSGDDDICENADLVGLFNFQVGKVGVVIGSPWNDKLNGGDGIDVILGLGGDDCIKSKDGIDIVFGMQGDDSIYAGDHHDFVTGNRGDDIVRGGKGKDYTFTIGTATFKVWLGNLLDGGGGDDKIFGHADSGASAPWTDIMFGDGLAKPDDRGKDEIEGSGGIDFLFGQSKDDTLSMRDSGKIQINAVDNPFGSFFFGDVGGDTISGSDNVDFAFGGKGDDKIDVKEGLDFAFGNADDDKIEGGENFDLLFGGPGDDEIEGGVGGIDDLEILFGSEDNDQITDKDGVFSIVVGNIGDDTIFTRAEITLGLGNSGGDFVTGGPGFSLLFGGKGADTMRGGDVLPSLISGDKDNDIVYGGASLVSLNVGGAGSDMVIGGDPYDANAVDLFDVNLGITGTDYIDGQGAVDLSFGGADNDVVKGGDDMDSVGALIDINVSFGNSGDDCVLGGAMADVLIGNGGDDRLWNQGVLAVHLGGSGTDINFGTETILSSDIVIGDSIGEISNIGRGPDLVLSGGGDDQINSVGMAMLLAGDGDDRASLGGLMGNIALGGNGADHLSVRETSLSVILAGADNDRTSGGSYAFGNTGADQMSNHRMSFGGQDNDTIRSRAGMIVKMSLALGGEGNDNLLTTDAKDFGFGNKGNDMFQYGEGKNRAWGGKGADWMNGYFVPQSGSDEKDKLRGGRDSDKAWGDNNTKDKRKAEWKAAYNDISGWTALAAPAAPLAPNAPQPSCAIPTDFDRFLGAYQVGSKLTYQDWMDDFWED